jgi:hypothetical protein
MIKSAVKSLENERGDYIRFKSAIFFKYNENFS